MIFRNLLFIMVYSLWAIVYGLAYAEEQKPVESDQQINDFSLSGYGEKGKKSWDLSGKTADIFNELVKLKDVVGNLYGKEEDVKLTAKEGDFNKVDNKIHLQDNVVITTSSGTKLTTDSLDWDRKNQLVTTKDLVNIFRDNMVTRGIGAVGQMGFKQVTLQKDVVVDILPLAKDGKPQDVRERIVITCDGPLEVDYEKNIAIFINNVKVDRTDSVIYSDRMDIYFVPSNKTDKQPKEAGETKATLDSNLMGSKIDKIIAKGNVRVIRGDNISYSDEATYNAADKKIILTGRPKLVIYSTEDFKNAPVGN